MSLAAVIELIAAIAVFAGLIFAALELRHFRQSREREAALQLFDTFQRRDFVRGLRLISELPEDRYSAEKIIETLGEDMDKVFYVISAFEGLGVLVQRGEVKLDLVEDFFSGVILETWRKVKPYVEWNREKSKRGTFNEYNQWLVERIMANEAKKPVIPAYEEFVDWDG